MENLPIIEILNKRIKHLNGALYYVGGCVRDQFLNKKSKDIDLLACGINANELEIILEEVFKDYGFKFVGESFGVYKVQIEEYELDIALPRIEKSTGDLHNDFDVVFGSEVTLEQDLQRRDFSINSLAMEISTHKIIDLFGGIKDLNSRILRQITPNSITEDYLRALRAIQFASRFGFTIDKTTFRNIKENCHLIKTISAERIRIELDKLLVSDNIVTGISYLRYSGILEYIMPEILAMDMLEFNVIHHKFNTYYHTLQSVWSSENILELRLALLLHDIGKPHTVTFDDDGIVHNYGHEVKSEELARNILERLKYDNNTIDIVCCVIKNHIQGDLSNKRIRKLVSLHGFKNTELIIKHLYCDKYTSNNPMNYDEKVRWLDYIEELKVSNQALKVTDLAINGHDIMNNKGYYGKQIGNILNILLNDVIEELIVNDKEQLLSYINKIDINRIFGETNGC